MTLTQIPEFGFFVQNSRIGVKYYRSICVGRRIPSPIGKNKARTFQVAAQFTTLKVLSLKIENKEKIVFEISLFLKIL